MEKIKIKNARLSFPNLFQTSCYGGEDTGKYDATFILDKKLHAKEIVDIEKGIANIVRDQLKGKHPGADRTCLKDGDETEREEQQGAYVIKASTKRRPLVLDRDKSPLTEEDNKIYAGCYVNGIITLWAQNNAYGRRINASLEGIQFSSHGEPFGPPAIGVNEFDAFGDPENSNDMPF